MIKYEEKTFQIQATIQSLTKTVLSYCCVMQYLVNFIVFQSSGRRGESWFLYFVFLVSGDCNCSAGLPQDVVGWSAMCYCISWS